jgi:hypothetical protein
MDGDRVELNLLRATDDPTQFSDEYQAELEDFDRGLRRYPLGVTSFAAHQGGDGTLLGQFIVSLGPAFVTGVAAVAGAWVQARFGRKVRLKFGDIEAEARTPEELEELLKRAAEFRNNKRDTGEDRP